MLLSPRNNGITSLFKEVRDFEGNGILGASPFSDMGVGIVKDIATLNPWVMGVTFSSSGWTLRPLHHKENIDPLTFLGITPNFWSLNYLVFVFFRFWSGLLMSAVALWVGDESQITPLVATVCPQPTSL